MCDSFKNFISIISVSFVLISCGGLVSENDPAEFRLAEQEIELADDENVADFFPQSLDRASQSLESAVELNETSRTYRDPQAQSQKQQEAVGLANEARQIAANAREAYRRVKAVDADITLLKEKQTTAKAIEEIERNLSNQMKTELEDTKRELKKAEEKAAADATFSKTVAFFPTNQSNVNEKARADIREVATVMERNPNLRAEITGFTDPRGSKAHNQKLSQLRSDSVRQELLNEGVEESRIDLRPVGEQFTAAVGRSPGDLQLARKVEVRLYHQPQDNMQADSPTTSGTEVEIETKESE